jgi:NAD(P)-dependent dehydrogenase (short-subunit alcohol dehydrogenase family)
MKHLDTFDLTGKVALITGAARGIGKSIAGQFSTKGAKLILLDMSSDISEIAASFGKDTIGILTDVTDETQVNRAVQQGHQTFGCIDILVNNAGVVRLSPAESHSNEDWDLTMNVNLKAPFLMSRAVGTIMIKQGSGNIINLASQAALVALDQHLAYCASKAAIVSMTKVWALEWAKHGITVNAIAPTVVLTELGKQAWSGEKGEAMKQKIPLQKFAMPEDIAAVALFLASDAARMITGETIVVDGGFTIQ